MSKLLLLGGGAVAVWYFLLRKRTPRAQIGPVNPTIFSPGPARRA